MNLYIKCITDTKTKFGFKLSKDVKTNKDSIEVLFEGKEVDELIETIINEIKYNQYLKDKINEIKDRERK